MIRINAENYRQLFAENRTKYNHKVVIDKQSFSIRGLSISSFGFSDFHSYFDKEIKSKFVINTKCADNYEYSGLSISIVLTAIDSEGFILEQQDTTRRHDASSIDLLAFSVDESAQIRVFASGDIPFKYDAKEIAKHKKQQMQQQAEKTKYIEIIQHITEHAGDYDEYKIAGFIKSVNHRIEEEAHKGKYYIQIGQGTAVPFTSSIVNIERACDELNKYYTEQGFTVSRDGTKIQKAWKENIPPIGVKRKTRFDFDPSILL